VKVLLANSSKGLKLFLYVFRCDIVNIFEFLERKNNTCERIIRFRANEKCTLWSWYHLKLFLCTILPKHNLDHREEHISLIGESSLQYGGKI